MANDPITNDPMANDPMANDSMANDSMANDKVYIHELIEIRGQHRADYMHHMTVNWVPIAIEERNQRCFGVWGTVGSTGRWPEVVNLWELDGWDGLVANFDHELSHSSLQDPSLAQWWTRAAEFRRGGFDRILVPAPWTRSIDQLVADGAGGAVYAHELVTVRPGAAPDYLDALRDEGRHLIEDLGPALLGAFEVAMVNASECVVIWSMSDWRTWGAFERAAMGEALAPWRSAVADMGANWRRCAMVEAPTSTLRLGRQPEAGDR